MLGGVAEMYAYGSSARDSVPLSCCNSEGDFSKVCDSSSAVFGGYRNSFALQEDFILLAECDENTGPEPLDVIPKGAARGLNLNTLTLKLLSSDYQGYGTSSSVPIQDTQALFPDIFPNIHVVVNYFALADIHSRGYVRPLCIAYFSSDKFKIIQNFLAIKKSLSEVCEIIKFHNRCLFIQDIEFTVQDLMFTKQVMQDYVGPPVSPNNTVSRLQEELLDVTISDLQNLQKKLQPLIDNHYEEQIEQSVTFLRHLRQAEQYKSFCSNMYLQWHFQRKVSVYKPQVLKLPLRSNFQDKLRPIAVICDIGFLMALFSLHVIHKFFKRKYENVFLAGEEQFKNGKILKFGACLKGAICQSSDLSKCNKTECHKFCKLVPNSPKNILKTCYRFLDNDFFDLMLHFYSRKCEIGIQLKVYNDNKVTSKEQIMSDKLSNCNFVSKFNEVNNPSCHWHGYSIVGMLDVIDEMKEIYQSDTTTVLDVLQQCNHLPDLFYSLLMGRCVIIMGTFECATTVQALVRVLGLVCPRDPERALYAQPWREVTTCLRDLTDMALIGMPLPSENSCGHVIPKSVLDQVTIWNMKAGTVSGSSYKGILLCDLHKRIKSVPPKGPLLATLVSFLSDLELQVLIWRAICKQSNQASVMSNKYFTEKGYSRNDLDILETLSTVVS